MLLNDRQIIEHIENDLLGISPFDKELVQPASVDVRLGKHFRWLDGRDRTIDYGDNVYLHPGAFLLGHTVEQVELPANIAARFEGKSSLGRQGLMTHITAGFIDPGFEGQITVELYNVSRMTKVLEPGMLIGQLCFFQMAAPCERPYGSDGLGSHYQGQMGATSARI